MGKDKGAVIKIAGDVTDLFAFDPDGQPFRNPDRIPHMINLMYAAWCLPLNRDLRMGQLLMNAARFGGHGPNDIWNVEEAVYAKGFLAMIKMGAEEDPEFLAAIADKKEDKT